MSVHNAAPYLDAAVRSIRDQSFSDFEFLIADDGSTDASGAILARHAQADDRICLVSHPNKGAAAARNGLIAKARAPLIASMDGDDLSDPDRFARQIAVMGDRPDLVVLGTRGRLIDPAGKLLETITRHPLNHQDIVANFGQRPDVLQSSVIMRREAVERVGGYRPIFKSLSEDLDLWLRLSRIGALANLPEPLVSYRVSTGQVSQRHVIDQAVYANIALFCHDRVTQGNPDPLDGLCNMPDLNDLEAITGAKGIARHIRARAVARTLFAAAAIADSGVPLYLTHIAEHPKPDQGALWRTAARLLRAGHPTAAGRLALALGRRAVRF